MVLKRQLSNMSTKHAFKTQMICLPHDRPRVGELEQIKKEKFNLGCMQRREKGLIKNAAK